jgi:putative hemolysin
MPRRILVLAAAASLAGCTTYMVWKEAAADSDLGIVQLAYEYNKFQSPQVDERAGISMARERCADWGYRDAQRNSEDQQCIEGIKTDCSKWRVIREYQCVKNPAK